MGIARDVLVQAVPLINDKLKYFHHHNTMVWSIHEKPTVMTQALSGGATTMAAHQSQMDARQASLEHLILERYDLNDRRRIASSSDHQSQQQVEVWEYSTPESSSSSSKHYGVRSLFINGFLQSTTHPSGIAHVEALVHPALISISSEKQELPRVAILSLEPTAIVREVLKHKRVESITLLGVSQEAIDFVQEHLEALNDCSFLPGRETNACLAQPEVTLIAGNVDEWLTTASVADGTKGDRPLFHAFFVDVPIGNTAWMDSALHEKIASLLHRDGVAVVSSGSVPMLSDSYDQSDELSARDVLLRQATRSKENSGIGYLQAYVYDEPLARPLASSFITLFPQDSDTIPTYLQTNAPAIEIAIVKQLHPMTTGGPPTLVYDGATHASYHTPSRAWQNWYCHTSPGKDLHVCNSFLNDWYNPEKHHYQAEVRKDAVKGRSLHALEDVPVGHFLVPDDAAMVLRIDTQRWSMLNEFVERFPDADMYRQIRDFFDAYGFESIALGLGGWAVSVGSNATFVNHGCTEEERNVVSIEDVFVGEDGDDILFSPMLVRFGELTTVLIHTMRDIAAGEEIQMDYADCTDIARNEELMKMCSTGVGSIDPIDGHSLFTDDVDSRTTNGGEDDETETEL